MTITIRHRAEEAVVRHALAQRYLRPCVVERTRRELARRGVSSGLLAALRPHLPLELLPELRTLYDQYLARRSPTAQLSALDGDSSEDMGALIVPIGSAPRPAGSSRRSGRIGGYRILEELARGGMGVVYRARHEGLGRDVALKVLGGKAEISTQGPERFRLEALATAQLRHPHIVAVHDVGEDEGHPYLVMDLAAGGNLRDRLYREGPLAPREAADIVRKLAGALHHAHERLILHRDVKPSNIFIDAEGEPLLGDFGLAKFVEAKAGPTVYGQILGTPAYMPPEQALANRPPDWRADVYSLGATLYSMLTGKPPFEGESRMQIMIQVSSVEPLSPSELRPDLPAELEAICLKCLEKEPEQRYISAKELADDLGRFLGGEPVGARPPAPGVRALKWARRNRDLTWALASTAAMLLVSLCASFSVTHTQAQAERRIESTRVEADLNARAELIAEAHAATEATWDELRASDSQDDDRRTALALASLQAAQRWQAQSRADPRARQAMFRAALELGEVAHDSAQWSLALEAFGIAESLGIDDALARHKVDLTEKARQCSANQRRLGAGWVLD